MVFGFGLFLMQRFVATNGLIRDLSDLALVKCRALFSSFNRIFFCDFGPLTYIRCSFVCLFVCFFFVFVFVVVFYFLFKALLRSMCATFFFSREVTGWREICIRNIDLNI